jgi:hypothetical protein
VRVPADAGQGAAAEGDAVSTGWLFGYGGDGRVTEDEVRGRSAIVPLMVGFGAGVNSTAMVIEMHRRGIRPDAILFADTGNEWPETYAAVDLFARWAEARLLPFTVVRRHSPETGDKTLEENCLRLKTLPSRAFGQSSCAFKWKIEAQEQWVSRNSFRAKGHSIVKALGYDAGEEYRATIHEKDGYRYWYPLQEWCLGREDCERLILSEGLPLPRKSACFFCPSMKPREIVELYDTHPGLYARAVAMERLAVAAMDEEADRTERETGERPDRTVVGLGRHWSWESVIAMTEAQRAKLPAPAEGCMVCHADGCDREAA